MRYLVTSEINGDEELLDTMAEVNEYIEQELKNHNQYEHKEPYTEEDFSITEVPDTCRFCNDLIDDYSVYCSYECSKADNTERV